MNKKQITEEKINEAAKFWSQPDPDEEQTEITGFIQDEAYRSFVKGAQWMQEQLSPTWVPYQSKEYFDMEITDNDLLLFDNGEMRQYKDDWPVNEITHVLFVPKPPNSRLNH